MRVVYYVLLAILIVGGLNWGLVGFLGFNLVDAVFGVGSVLSQIVYIIVGLSALYVGIYALMKGFSKNLDIPG